MCDTSDKTPTYRAIVIARMMLVICVVCGAWFIWVTSFPPSPTIVSSSAGVLLGVVTAAVYRLARAKRGSGSPPNPLAWTPVVCVGLTFVVYGVTLAFVRGYRIEGYLRQVDRIQTYERALAKTETKLLADDDDIEVRMRRKARSRFHTAEVGKLHTALARNRRELSAIADQRHAHDFPTPHVSHPRGVLTLTWTGPARAVESLLRSKANDLPAWFGRLGSFFMVATQLLAGLAIVLAFSRWSKSETSEAVFRSAMPVVTVGVAFGLAGNLPSLSRSLQAAFLGPVLAALAGAVGALVVAAVSSPSEGAGT